uniref:Cytochrome P450 n=1 Tax=Panagrolaimus sp. JU765 TaxID=591449 RepID=A0AC34RBZ9_9BILA
MFELPFIRVFGPGDFVLFGTFFVLAAFKLLPVIFATILVLTTFLVVYLELKSINNYWKKQNVPGPEGNLFLGSLLDLAKDVYGFDAANFGKYGKFYGSMMKGIPDFATTDVDMIQQVLISEFENFSDPHNFVFDSKSKNNLRKLMLNVQRGGDWRRIRRKITPALTSAKMKQLIPGMSFCIRELANYLQPFVEEDKDIPLKEVYSKLTFNVIGRTVFSGDFNAFSSQNDVPFLANAKKVFGGTLMSPAIIISFFFPFCCGIYEILTGKCVIRNEVNDYFLETLSGIVEQRVSDPDARKKNKDAVQLLLNAIEDHPENVQLDQDLVSEVVQNSVANQKVSKMEIMAQMLIFLAAGSETTASTLHFVTYILSLKPEIQEKVRSEAFQVLGQDLSKEVTMEDLNKLKYMDQVILETLRMYSPGARLNRSCNKRTVVNGIVFEPGSSFSVSPIAIHYCADYYEDPHVFDPERFTPENRKARHPMAFLAFGGGPRICIGMRFAEFEMKAAMAFLVRKYQFLPSENMPGLPVPFRTTGLLAPTVQLKCRFKLLSKLG